MKVFSLDLIVACYRDVFQDVFHKVWNKRCRLTANAFRDNDMPSKSDAAEKDIASQVVLEEEGAREKEVMLRAPEARPKKCALPPYTHIRHKKTWRGPQKKTITAHDQI